MDTKLELAANRDKEDRKKALAYIKEFRKKRAHIYKNKRSIKDQSTIVGALKSSPGRCDRRQSILVSIRDFQSSPHSPTWKGMSAIPESPETRLKQAKATADDLKSNAHNSISLGTDVFESEARSDLSSSSSSSSSSAKSKTTSRKPESESEDSFRKKQPLDTAKI